MQRNLTIDYLSFTGQRNILNGINGQFRAHELTAIMGPSGAGKSTLLNILAGLRQQSSGTIKLNNKCRTKINYRKMSRYIQQDMAYQVSVYECI